MNSLNMHKFYISYVLLYLLVYYLNKLEQYPLDKYFHLCIHSWTKITHGCNRRDSKIVAPHTCLVLYTSILINWNLIHLRALTARNKVYKFLFERVQVASKKLESGPTTLFHVFYFATNTQAPISIVLPFRQFEDVNDTTPSTKI